MLATRCWRQDVAAENVKNFDYDSLARELIFEPNSRRNLHVDVVCLLFEEFFFFEPFFFEPKTLPARLLFSDPGEPPPEPPVSSEFSDLSERADDLKSGFDKFATKKNGLFNFWFLFFLFLLNHRQNFKSNCL